MFLVIVFLNEIDACTKFILAHSLTLVFNIIGPTRFRADRLDASSPGFHSLLPRRFETELPSTMGVYRTVYSSNEFARANCQIYIGMLTRDAVRFLV